MKRRAFTLIEVTLTVALIATVTGAVISLFGFATVRLCDAYTRVMVSDQINAVADRIESTIREAHSCTISGTALVCTMPNAGKDIDGDGHLDLYNPSGIDASGYATYTAGNYVWYYAAGVTGDYGSGSGCVWRAEPTTSASPTMTDLDTSFAYYYGGKAKNPLVSTLTVLVASAARSVTFTVGANGSIGRTVQNLSGDTNAVRSVTVTRTVVWRNWR